MSKRVLLTGFELGISVEQAAFLLVKGFLIEQVFLRLSQLPQQPEFSIQIPSLHTFSEFMQRHTFLDFSHVLVLQDPLVGEILRWLRTLNERIRWVRLIRFLSFRRLLLPNMLLCYFSLFLELLLIA